MPGGSAIKNMPDNAEDKNSIPGSGRSPGKGNGNPLHYSAWEIPWTEETGRLQSMGLPRVGYNLVTEQQQFVCPKNALPSLKTQLKYTGSLPKAPGHSQTPSLTVLRIPGGDSPTAFNECGVHLPAQWSVVSLNS